MEIEIQLAPETQPLATSELTLTPPQIREAAEAEQPTKKRKGGRKKGRNPEVRFRLDKELFAQVEKLCAEQEMSMQEWMREVVAEKLEQGETVTKRENRTLRNLLKLQNPY